MVIQEPAQKLEPTPLWVNGFIYKKLFCWKVITYFNYTREVKSSAVVMAILQIKIPYQIVVLSWYVRLYWFNETIANAFTKLLWLKPSFDPFLQRMYSLYLNLAVQYFKVTTMYDLKKVFVKYNLQMNDTSQLASKFHKSSSLIKFRYLGAVIMVILLPVTRTWLC